jgi:hypothetical protein
LDASTSTNISGFIPFLQNNQTDILLNPKCSISISVGTTMSINIIDMFSTQVQVTTPLPLMPATSLH